MLSLFPWKRYPISDQNGQKSIPVFRPKRLKNDTLTYIIAWRAGWAWVTLQEENWNENRVRQKKKGKMEIFYNKEGFTYR